MVNGLVEGRTQGTPGTIRGGVVAGVWRDGGRELCKEVEEVEEVEDFCGFCPLVEVLVYDKGVFGDTLSLQLVNLKGTRCAFAITDVIGHVLQGKGLGGIVQGFFWLVKFLPDNGENKF